MSVYVDTSVLAKRYLNEHASDAVDAFLAEHEALVISTLTSVEMRSLLARRSHRGEIDARMESQCFAAFQEDLLKGFFLEEEMTTAMFRGAMHLMAQLVRFPVRTLDALHLAAAQQTGADMLATADMRMRDAAAELGMTTRYFGTT